MKQHSRLQPFPVEQVCICCGANLRNVSWRNVTPALFCTQQCENIFQVSGVHRLEIDSFLLYNHKQTLLDRIESLSVPVKLQINCKKAEGIVELAVVCVGSIYFEVSLEVSLEAEGVGLSRHIESTEYYRKPGMCAVREVAHTILLEMSGPRITEEDPSITTASATADCIERASLHSIEIGSINPELLLPPLSSDQGWMRQYNELRGKFELQFKEEAQEGAQNSAGAGQLQITGNLISSLKWSATKDLPGTFQKVYEDEVTGELLMRQSTSAATTEFSGTLTVKGEESTHKVQIIQGWIQGWPIQMQDEDADDLESNETQITMVLSFSGQLAERPRQLCKICGVNEKAHATWPCLHFFCQKCSRKLASKRAQNAVPSASKSSQKS